MIKYDPEQNPYEVECDGRCYGGCPSMVTDCVSIRSANAYREGYEQALRDAEPLIDYIAERAKEECVYRDGCPDFVKTNHYRCDPCQCRCLLNE